MFLLIGAGVCYNGSIRENGPTFFEISLIRGRDEDENVSRGRCENKDEFKW
jgi:hypothetical protein